MLGSPQPKQDFISSIKTFVEKLVSQFAKRLKIFDLGSQDLRKLANVLKVSNLHRNTDQVKYSARTDIKVLWPSQILFIFVFLLFQMYFAEDCRFKYKKYKNRVKYRFKYRFIFSLEISDYNSVLLSSSFSHFKYSN